MDHPDRVAARLAAAAQEAGAGAGADRSCASMDAEEQGIEGGGGGEYDSADEMDPEEAAMAAAMGFSSFGTKDKDRPSKKRRFNNHGGGDDGEVPITGANMLALPSHRVGGGGGGGRSQIADGEGQEENKEDGGAIAAAAAAAPHPQARQSKTKKVKSNNADEIDLDADDDSDDDDDNHDDKAGASILPPPSVIPSLPPRPTTATSIGGGQGDLGSGGQDWTASSRGGGGFGGSKGRGGGYGGSHGHGHNREWYIDYYDPSSNENPWERLEQAKALGPAPGSSWLSPRQSSTAGGGRGGG
ncbi:hypothetical protein B0H63DRAFT_470264 [Podospora didyma]|uniref:Uncharacterized protein n=1 Tax=Podospora didyma TaxID=330526 RepID=A0AAE0NTP3_9PEZI|nr:hypothetical protein B0H63DRAFT_470264 [Podospora didyma]